MLTHLQLQRMAWEKLATAKTLASVHPDTAVYEVGYAIEFIVKARLVVDLGLPGWPSNRAEFQQHGLLHLKSHGLEALLQKTKAAHLKATHAKEWGNCLKWSPDTRYQPVGTANVKSALELIASAEVILDEAWRIPGLRAEVAKSENPYVKIRAAQRDVETRCGPLRFLGILHRKGSLPHTSDLVVSAPWIEKDWRAGMDEVVDAVKGRLDEEEMKTLAGFIYLEAAHPLVKVANSVAHIDGGVLRIVGGGVWVTPEITVRIADGIILASRKLN